MKTITYLLKKYFLCVLLLLICIFLFFWTKAYIYIEDTNYKVTLIYNKMIDINNQLNDWFNINFK